VAALTVVEIFRQGAFFPQDAFAVAVLSACLIGTAILSGIDRRARYVTLAIATCALWWLTSALYHGHGGTFLPLGASMIGFLGAFLVVRRLDDGQRVQAARVLATIGAAAAALGLEATVVRHYPLAMPAQNLWRLASTLTYSDAAGLLLGIALLVGLGLDPHKPLTRIDVYLCTAGLVATQSRGAVLAVAAGAALVPLMTARRAIRPVLFGLVVGLVVVATSSGPAAHPWAAILILVGLGAAVGVPPSVNIGRLPQRDVVITALAAIVCAGIAAAALHTQIQRRTQFASTNDRLTEWSAAIKQWESSPLIGAGPDALLHFHARDGTFAHFAHNEYLQVAADSGTVGFLLLLVVCGTLFVTVRRRDDATSCACAALVAFAVAGALDFDWHLSALGLIGGWVAGLASRPHTLSLLPKLPAEVAVTAVFEPVHEIHERLDDEPEDHNGGAGTCRWQGYMALSQLMAQRSSFRDEVGTGSCRWQGYVALTELPRERSSSRDGVETRTLIRQRPRS